MELWPSTPLITGRETSFSSIFDARLWRNACVPLWRAVNADIPAFPKYIAAILLTSGADKGLDFLDDLTDSITSGASVVGLPFFT